MKKTLILSSFLFLFFTAESQMIIVDVGPFAYDFTGGENVNSTKVITYSPDGTHSSLDMTNVPVSHIESTAFVTAHLNSIISQGYRLIKIQDYNQVNSATGNINYHVVEDDFPLERTVYYFAVPWTSSGLDEINSSEFDLNLSPNPANDFVTVKFEKGNTSFTEILLINTNGFVCKRVDILDSDDFITSKIDISKLPAGSYFIRLVNKREYSQAKKLIVH